MLAAIKSWLSRIAEKHNGLIEIAGGLTLIGLTYRAYRHYIASASLADFFTYLLDPGKVAVLPSTGDNAGFQFTVAMAILGSWITTWRGAVEYAWELIERSTAACSVALSLLLVPAGFILFFWHTMWLVRAGIIVLYLIMLTFFLQCLVIEEHSWISDRTSKQRDREGR